MKKILRDNGLSLALSGLFLLSLVGMIAAGLDVENQELAEHGAAAMTLAGYLASGGFLSALFENWESEFLQMAAYVLLTATLFQRGSAESRDPDDPERPNDARSRLPGGRHGLPGWLYAHSLGIALTVLFAASFGLHWWSSLQSANAEAALHGQPGVNLLQHLGSAELWFESFQNWQSEFLSTGVLLVFSIFLRFRGSPQSKAVADPDDKTGAD